MLITNVDMGKVENTSISSDWQLLLVRNLWNGNSILSFSAKVSHLCNFIFLVLCYPEIQDLGVDVQQNVAQLLPILCIFLFFYFPLCPIGKEGNFLDVANTF